MKTQAVVSGAAAVADAAAPTGGPAQPKGSRCDGLEACEARCASGDAIACTDAGHALDAAWPYDAVAAAEHFDRACTLGDPNGCAALAVLYQDGRGRPHDDARALELYNQACDAGSGVGCFNAGLMHEGGNGAELDRQKSRAAFQRAESNYRRDCDAGGLEWCMNLGFVFEHGYGQTIDLAKARAAYGEGCEGGHPGSCANLALMDLQPSSPDVAIDPAAAKAAGARLEALCGEGSALACGIVGHAYLKPDSPLGRDAKRGAELTERACQLGDPRGCTLFAGVLSLGEDMPPDPDRAQRYVERGCALGSSDACYLASMHWGPQEAEKAIPWLERACNIGHADGCGQLGAHYQIGMGIELDDARAQALYVESCRLGAVGACVELIHRGAELPLPPELATPMLEQACRSGIEAACPAGG